MSTPEQHFDAARKFQAFYDEALRKVGMRAPQPTLGETVGHYRRETLRNLKRTFLPQNHELAKVLKRLAPGDVLLVTRLDRLARSTRDLLNILADISQHGSGFKSLHDAWADTTTPPGRLMLTVLGGFAEFERELILARTSDGRQRAKARGVRCGRPG